MSTTQLSERFGAPDADLTILSSDGVIFKVHRKNLELHSDVFADAANATSTDSGNDEPVELSESSAVLDLLFQYMYRQPQPNLQPVDFSVFAGLAEAAEKYVVYAALPAVMARMKEYISRHPVDVLDYAAKHDHKELGSEAARSCISEHPLNALDYAAKTDLKELANEAARLSIALPISKAASILAPPTFTKWMSYYDQWHSEARKTLGMLLLLSGGKTADGKTFSANIPNLSSCVRDPYTCYKVRQELENVFASHEGLRQMTVGKLNFLDKEFMPGS